MDMKRRISSINNDNYWEQLGNIREKNEEGERVCRGDFIRFGRAKALGHYTCYTPKNIRAPFDTLGEIS